MGGQADLGGESLAHKFIPSYHLPNGVTDFRDWEKVFKWVDNDLYVYDSTQRKYVSVKTRDFSTR